jgi:hypothetical protein
MARAGYQEIERWRDRRQMAKAGPNGELRRVPRPGLACRGAAL